MNRIHREKERVIEGRLRCSQLVKYLKSIDSPNSVFLSEDGSGVVRKIVYDAHLNQLVGLVQPFNDETGMPKLFAFQADSAEEIERIVQLPQSSLVYIIVAQPLKNKSAPFILFTPFMEQIIDLILIWLKSDGDTPFQNWKSKTIFYYKPKIFTTK